MLFVADRRSTAPASPGDVDDPAEAYRLLVADVYEFAGRSRSTSDAFARRRGGTAAQWHVLSVVLDEPRTVPQIAERLGQARQSVQAVVDGLAQAGWVRLSENPLHARSKLVRPTPSGERFARGLFEESGGARRSQIEEAGLAIGDLNEARRVVRALLGALDEDDG